MVYGHICLVSHIHVVEKSVVRLLQFALIFFHFSSAGLHIILE